MKARVRALRVKAEAARRAWQRQVSTSNNKRLEAAAYARWRKAVAAAMRAERTD